MTRAKQLKEGKPHLYFRHQRWFCAIWLGREIKVGISDTPRNAYEAMRSQIGAAWGAC